jgi:molybdate transport system permease protein
MGLSREEWEVVFFSLRMAATSTLLIVVPGVFLAWLLARRRFFGKTIVETLVALPLVIPPVATGLILLQLFGKRGVFGEAAAGWLQLVFTWRGVVAAMAVMSFPLLVRTARVGFEEVDVRLEQIARTLGATEKRIFFTVTLPLAVRGVIGGVLFAFARALGEFGATIVIAGNIPERTATIATTIYNQIELGDDAAATRLLIVAVLIAFAAVWASELALRKRRLS